MAGKKIHFKKTFSDGSQREDEGILYTTKNGIKVALHKEVHPNGSTWWKATELTTGKQVTRDIYRTMKEAKAEVETVSPVVAKVLDERKNSCQSVKPAKQDKPKKSKAAKTTPKTQLSNSRDKLPKSQQLPVDKPLPQNKSAGTYIDDRNAPIKPKAKKEKPLRPNPFEGADDIYVTKSKIAVTKTKKSKAKRGYTKTTQTKYYEQNESNLKLLKKAQGDAVRSGRKGTQIKKL